MKEKLFAGLSIVIAIAATLAIAEIACRILPVSEGLSAMPVNAAAPVFHFAPNREATWSRDWDFSIVNKLRVNNAGYVNDQDYDEKDPRPLLAVVGDSYVEAAMVPYRETLHGRLAAAFAPAHRVYSFAASGAALSQYLVWAREARATWRAQTLLIVVVGNDFDESLATYKAAPGFHHYVPNAEGALVLQRFDFTPGPLRVALRQSALARYVLLNLQAPERLHALTVRAMATLRPSPAETFVGNTATTTDAERLRLSKAAVHAFLRDLADYAGWPAGTVLFLVDGLRYSDQGEAAAGSYFSQMREFFLSEANKAGYEALDMDRAFFANHQTNGKRFEYQSDGHWNGLAHEIAAAVALASKTLSHFPAQTVSTSPER